MINSVPKNTSIESEIVFNFAAIKNANTKIIVAEDQMINMQVIKSQLKQLGLINESEFCYNGDEAVDQAIKIIGEVINNCFEWEP